jgi:hypothetical protein
MTWQDATYNDRWWQRPPSSARVKISTAKNGTFMEAFQFDPPVAGVPTPVWTLYPNFRMDIKAYLEQTSPLVSLTSASGQIVIDDAVQRLIHFNVPETILFPTLSVGEYLYDLIMFDNSSPALRVPLLHGPFILTDGVSGG